MPAPDARANKCPKNQSKSERKAASRWWSREKKKIALRDVSWRGEWRREREKKPKRNVNFQLYVSYEASFVVWAKKSFNLFVWFRLVLYSYLTKKRTVCVYTLGHARKTLREEFVMVIAERCWKCKLRLKRGDHVAGPGSCDDSLGVPSSSIHPHVFKFVGW